MGIQRGKDPHDGDYMGNIFGWRISLFGLIVLLFFLGWILYRHYALDVPPGFEWEDDNPPAREMDSLESTGR
jgi:hypothetical protein